MSTFRQKVQANTDWGKPDPEEQTPIRANPRGKWAARHAAQHNRIDERGRKGPKRRGVQSLITRHRLFPAFAALWFAALFGLGGLAISSAALGKLVMATGVLALVPAAAPPLGLTAHLLVALALAIAGGAFGLVLGLRLRPKTAHAPDHANSAPSAVPLSPEDDCAAVPRVRARDAHPDAPPRRPLVLTEAFAEEPMAQAAPGGYRPAGFATASAMEVAPETWVPVGTSGTAHAQEPLDLAAAHVAEFETLHSPTDFPAADLAPDLAGQLATDAAVSGAAPFAEPALLVASGPEIAAELESEAPQATDILPEGAPETPDAEADAEADADAEAVSVADMPWPVLLAATPQFPSGYALPLPGDGRLAVGETWSPVAGVPLQSLGLVQLIERLALAIAARKAADNAGPSPLAHNAPPESGPESGPESEPESGSTDYESPSAEGIERFVPDDQGPACEAAGDPLSAGFVSSYFDADLEADVPVAEPFAPFAKPAEPVKALAGEPVLSPRDAIERRLHAVSALVHVKPAPDAGPGPFSRPQPAPPAASGPAASEPATSGLTAQASSAQAPFSGSMVNAAANPETNEALRSALATLQRMSARG